MCNCNINKIEKKQCTGCKMCGDICPQKAISYYSDKEGFWYPKVDDTKCTRCGLCYSLCPANCDKNISVDYEGVAAYEVVNRDNSIRKRSTSGGLFFALASTIINEEGVVIACAYADDYKSSRHICVEKLDELYKLMGTKYFQSDTSESYSLVKAKLCEGKKVLFVGTPCQNAALRCLLKKDYDNLFQLDFVCNSITSPLVYKKWLLELEQKYNSAISEVVFKYKKYPWKSLSTMVKFCDGTEHIEDKYDSYMEKGLVTYNLFQRPSCYECFYRSMPHYYSDITCGDYWGLEDIDSYDEFAGVSFAIINSEKGKILFEKTKSQLFIKKTSLESIISGNRRSVSNPVMDKRREVFFNKLQSHSFTKAFEIAVPEEKHKAKRYNISKEISDLLFIIKNSRYSLTKYVYYNYFSKNIIRKGLAKIFPDKNAIINLDEQSSIIIEGNQNFVLGEFKLHGSGAETYLRLGKKARLVLHNGATMAYGTTIDIKNNAVLEAGFFSFNTGSAVVVQKAIEFGEEVVGGRSCIILDSDFHQLQSARGSITNPPKKVTISDHVWMAGDVRVLSGSSIGYNVVIAANSIIKGNIPSNSYVESVKSNIVNSFAGRWSRKTNNIISSGRNSKGNHRQILVGFGNDGKNYYSKQACFIDYIIDNGKKEKGVVSLSEFHEKYPRINDDSVFVIASLKYQKELTKAVKKLYPRDSVYLFTEIF